MGIYLRVTTLHSSLGKLDSAPTTTLGIAWASLSVCRHELEVARRHLVARVEELSAERETLRGECDTASRTLGRCQARLDETEAALAR